MRSYLLCLVIIFSAYPLGISTAQVKQVEQPLPTQAQEEQAQALFRSLRCVVCEGQNLAGSNADIAVDMRIIIRDQLKAGKSNDEIRDYLVSRYGESISLVPTRTFNQILLMGVPIIALLVGLIAIVLVRKRS